MNKTAIGRFSLAARSMIFNALSYRGNREETAYQLFFRLITSLYMKKNQIIAEDFLPESLSVFLPDIFEPMDDDDILTALMNPDGSLQPYLAEIPEEDWNQIEIIGWLYQAYLVPDKDAAFELLQNNLKIPSEAIAAATQLFTPDWVVHYLVQNSLGKLWMQLAPNSPQQADFDLYLPTEAPKNSARTLKQLRIIDPCAGSGHILVYAFRLLFGMYRESGYDNREAVRSILEHNLFGLDLDPRVTKIAYFALLMLAYRYDPDILSSSIRPQVYALSEPLADHLIPTEWMQQTIQFGSLAKVPKESSDARNADPALQKWHRIAEILSQKYDVVITNPPYMGKKSLNDQLSQYLTENFPEGKSELYAAFILRCIDLTKESGYTAMITIHSWMFIRSYEPLRRQILDHTHIDTLLHCGAGTFDELNSFNVLATAFCLQKIKTDLPSLFVRLCEQRSVSEKLKAFHQPENRFLIHPEQFRGIPGLPFVYHISDQAIRNFKTMQPLRVHSKPKQGIATADNKRFLRYWFEVPYHQICFDAENREDAAKSGCRWFPYNKGGNYRKWYGMNEYVIDWEEDGKRLRNNDRAVLRNMNDQFRPGITWSLFGFENFSVRYKTAGFLFDVSGSSIFPKEEELLYTLAFLASKTAFLYLSLLAPTVNFQVGNIADLPFRVDEVIKPEVERLARECIRISKEEWGDYEESWDFSIHPFLRHKQNTIAKSYAAWECYAKERYERFVKAEQRIHALFIRSYHLEQDLNDEIQPRNIAIRMADRKRDTRSFLSYVVGCIFGRYRLDAVNLPVYDNLLTPNQLTNAVIGLIREIWGKDTLDENLSFLAASLGKHGTPKQILTDYFNGSFWTDHLKQYKKHPIYWMYDTGDKNGFRAYFYLHRFQTEQLQNAFQTAKLHECRSEWLERMTRLIEQPPQIDLNDGVKVNYRKLSDVLAKLR